ncbi:MAG: hypothetical protein ABI328_05585 [Gemmatimonadaceae bacterium]
MRWKATGLCALLSVTAAVLVSCSSSTAPERVLVPIRQLVVPDSVGQNAVLPVDVTVEFGGCTSFTGVSFSRAPDHVTVAAWGERPTSPDIVCAQYLVSSVVHIDVPGPWNGGKLTVTAQEPGTTPPIVHDVQVR